MENFQHSLTMVASRKGEKGQAIFEFVIFIPFILVLIGTLVTIIGAINGSINQVKATRNYFFMITNNNSMIPTAKSLEEAKSEGIMSIGISSVGWKVKARGKTALAPCYKLSTFIGETPLNENCDDEVEDSISTFIKVKTLYGLCSATYDCSGSVIRLDPLGSHCERQ